MGLLAWTMMGLALWHFTVFLPDRCWSGIIGAFLGCVFGAIIFGLVIHGFAIPGQDDTDLITAMEAIPGAPSATPCSTCSAPARRRRPRATTTSRFPRSRSLLARPAGIRAPRAY